MLRFNDLTQHALDRCFAGRLFTDTEKDFGQIVSDNRATGSEQEIRRVQIGKADILQQDRTIQAGHNQHVDVFLFDMLRAGDVLVVRWVDRLGRDYADVTDTIRDLTRRGITVRTVINSMTFDRFVLRLDWMMFACTICAIRSLLSRLLAASRW